MNSCFDGEEVVEDLGQKPQFEYELFCAIWTSHFPSMNFGLLIGEIGIISAFERLCGHKFWITCIECLLTARNQCFTWYQLI